MSSPDSVNRDFVKTLDYTNKFLIPNPDLDSKATIIAKCAAIIFTLGLAFIVTLAMDLSKVLFVKLFYKDKPPIKDDDTTLSTSKNMPNPEDRNATTITPASTDPDVVNPKASHIDSTSQNIWDLAKTVFTKKNAKKSLQSAWEGFKELPEQSYNYLSNKNNDRYNNISYALGITIPYWVAGGFIRGSVVSLLLNGGNLARVKIHERLMVPPENR